MTIGKVIRAFFLILLFLALITSAIASLGIDNSVTEFHGKVSRTISGIDSFRDSVSGALFESEQNQYFSAASHALATIGRLSAHSLTSQSNETLSDDISTLENGLKYFNDPYSIDKRGIISWYDPTLEQNSYSRAPREARDQALMIWALSFAYEYLEETSAKRSEYQQIVSETWSFLEERFHDSDYSGWFRQLVPEPNSSFAVDKSKKLADQSWIIISLLHATEFPDFSFVSQEQVLTQCQNVSDFLWKYLMDDQEGGLGASSDRKGTSTDDIMETGANALFGIANWELYSKTGNSSFLQRSVKVWNFLEDKLWDRGFSGFFGAYSPQDQRVIFAGKRLDDNALAALLSLLLAGEEEAGESERYLDVFTRTIAFIEKNFRTNDLMIVSTDREGNPTSGSALFESAIYLWASTRSPHLLQGEHPESVPVGGFLNLNISLFSLYSVNITTTVNSPALDSTIKLVTLPQGISSNILDLRISESAHLTDYSLSVSIDLRGETIDKAESTFRVGGDIRIPRGVIYVLGAATLGTIVIFLRSPPKFFSSFIKAPQEGEEKKELSEEES